MIRYFSKIRKQILSENKLVKYLPYAIGEILLVSMGILLALQVNNWNEKRKQKIEEIETYYELKNDLNTSLENLMVEENYLAPALHRVYQAMKTKAPLTDSLKNAFTLFMLYHPVYFRADTYRSIKSRGSNLLTNTQLKNKITDLYDTELVWYQDGFLPIESKLVDKAMDYYTSHFETNGENPGPNALATPNDYDALLRDQSFLNLLSAMVSNRKGLLDWRGRIQVKISDLIKEINDEILKLTKQ